MSDLGRQHPTGLLRDRCSRMSNRAHCRMRQLRDDERRGSIRRAGAMSGERFISHSIVWSGGGHRNRLDYGGTRLHMECNDAVHVDRIDVFGKRSGRWIGCVSRCH
jgi:hypothetical protein